MNHQGRAGGARDAARLPPGTRFAGGRYTIGKRERQGVFAELYQASDATTGTPLSIHVIDPRLVQSRELVDRLAEAARRASGLDHKSIAKVIELAVEGENTYIATELVEGHSLRELLDRKRQTGTVGFGAKGASNILTHVGAALAAAAQTPHGAVTIDGVAVSRTGRIRVADFALWPLVPLVAAVGRQMPGFAPEVLAGAPPSEASDVCCLGALLYEVLIGSPPVKGCMRPSQAVPGVPVALDTIIARAMSPAPERRYPNVGALIEAASSALAEAARLSSAHPRQPGSAVLPAASQPSLAESLAGSARAPVPGSTPSAAMSAVLAQRDEKWLVSKGKLDYGPFTTAQVTEQIAANLILPGHVIIDKDTGDRTPVEKHPLLADLVESARHKRDEERRAHAEVEHATQEKRRGTALYTFIVLGVLALGGGAFFVVQELSAAAKDETGALESLEAGSLDAKISFPSEAEREKRARRSASVRRSGGRSSTSPGGVAGGYDDSLNLDLAAEESGDGGSERLSDDQVNPVIQQHGGALGRCLTSTGTHNAMIEFIVKPTGAVSQVRVNGQTAGAVANCIRGAMLKMKFPSFNGVRSKHYFDMAY
jgi:Protein tyrosine and serine/threonine kinase